MTGGTGHQQHVRHVPYELLIAQFGNALPTANTRSSLPCVALTCGLVACGACGAELQCCALALCALQVRRANAPAPSTSQRLNLTPCRTSKTGYCFATPNA